VADSQVIDRSKICEEYRTHETDCGSPEVQVALISARITHLTGHLKTHRKDFATQRGLLQLVGKRSRLLKYLARTDEGRYRNLIQRLGLRK
jgi:small subunit ribosomal protein S15